MIRRSIFLLLLAGLLLATIAGPALGQTSDDEELELRLEVVEVADFPEMGLIVSVPPELAGTLLTEDEFTVREGEDVRPETVTPVDTEGLQVVLVLDASTSMEGEPMASAKEAATSFLASMPEGVEVAVVAFASSPSVLSPFTTDLASAGAAVENLQVGGETALYDGLRTAADLFDEEAARRTVVVLSDGGDTVSDASLVDAFEALNAAEVSFYAVELQSPENDSAGLARLADETEGQVLAADDPSALTDAFDGVAAQIVNRYELRFTSEATGRTPLIVTAEADGVVATVTQAVRFPDPPAPPVDEVETAPVSPTEVAATPSTLREPSLVTLAWSQESVALWLGAGAVFLAIVGLVMFTGTGRKTDVRLVAANVRQRIGQSKRTALSTVAEQATAFAERTIDKRDRSGGLNARLESGGVQLRPGEYAVLTLALAFAAAALLYALTVWWLAIVGFVGALFISSMWLGFRVERRRNAFAEQLVDVLQLMAGSIRTGFGTMQAVDTVAREMAAPAGEEFQRVKVEVQLGRDSNESLRAMAQRVGSEDFEWVVEAMDIHREVGGDLADILDSVTETVRDRNRIRRRVKTLSAEGKFTGVVLSLLPLVLALAVTLLNPDYISELVVTTLGRFLIGIGVVALVTGIFWMRRITSLKY